MIYTEIKLATNIIYKYTTFFYKHSRSIYFKSTEQICFTNIMILFVNLKLANVLIKQLRIKLFIFLAFRDVFQNSKMQLFKFIWNPQTHVETRVIKTSVYRQDIQTEKAVMFVGQVITAHCIWPIYTIHTIQHGGNRKLCSKEFSIQIKFI